VVKNQDVSVILLGKAEMPLAHNLTNLQREQFRHDQRNHSDIICLSKPDRLKHYGLHFAKYVGRLARGSSELKAVERTITDTALVCLSAANTLHQRLDESMMTEPKLAAQIDPLRLLADAAGRFADACEKIDHLEEFLPIARQANVDILRWVLSFADERALDIQNAIAARRKELAERQFYVSD
jgi:hypothetical protein